jgi:hypothetical protein
MTVEQIVAMLSGGAVGIAGAIKWAVSVILNRMDHFAETNELQHARTRADIQTYEAHVNAKLTNHEARIYRIEDRFLPIKDDG